MQPIKGIHHITAIASEPQRNLDFYHGLLGQRFVKRTVNFDDPTTYHFYFGDEVGSPATILTFFPWRGLKRGRVGNGEVAAVGYRIPPSALDYWQERLHTHNISTHLETRFGQQVLCFEDPDGMALELVTDDSPSKVRHWVDSPIPEACAIQGFHGATIWVFDHTPSARLLTEIMGYTLVGQEGNRRRYRAAGEVGAYIDLVEKDGLGLGQAGAGSVHHIAFRTQSDEEQAEYRQALLQVGLHVTPVRDRQYFRSIYFREPNGVLYEIATDAPGFLVDEPLETLGHELKLPPWLEPQRAMISAQLPPITIPDAPSE